MKIIQYLVITEQAALRNFIVIWFSLMIIYLKNTYASYSNSRSYATLGPCLFIFEK